MRKYFLSVLTIFVHTFTNNSKNSQFIKQFKEDSGTQNRSIDKKQEFETQKIDSPKNLVDGQIHSATWYNMHGHKTASGDRFHKDSLTAAYNYAKLGSYLRVTNISTNLSVIVKVNDRMGYKGKNHIDLSKCAFDSIGNINSGRIKVLVEEIK